MECRPCAARGRLGSSRSPARQTRPRQQIARAHGPVGLPPRLSVLILGQRGQPEAVLVTAELLSTPRRTNLLVRAYAGESVAIPPERILIVATHTHAGPGPFGPALRIAFGSRKARTKLAAAVAYAAGRAKQNHQGAYGVVDSRLSTTSRIGAQAPRHPSMSASGRSPSTHQVAACCCGPTPAHPPSCRGAQRADGDYPGVAHPRRTSRHRRVIFLPGRTAHRQSRRSVTPTASRRCWRTRSAASRPSPRIRARR